MTMPDDIRILVVEDSPTQAQMIELILKEEGFSVDVSYQGLEGINAFEVLKPDLVILDIILPDVDGFTVCRRLKNNMKKYTPILMLTSRDETEDRVDALELGADDYMVKPFESREFIARIRVLLRIKRLQDELQAMLEKERESLKILKRVALVDHLTEVYNRHYFSEVLASEFEKAKRYENPLSCIIIDVDFFRDFNTRYGHDMGDWVLKETAATVKDCLRHADVLARYGGDEFVALLPMTEERDAAYTAERLRRAVSEKSWESDAGELDVSITLGVACTVGLTCSCGEDLIKRADKALYQAKEEGRNRVYRYSFLKI
jgi:diguanylate cyclase (GGDEF)-like protein